MTMFVVDCHLPGMSLEQIAAVFRAARWASEEFTAAGKPVNCLRTLFLPDDERCLCLFEAANAKAVQEVNELAQVPFTRIMEALDI